ncbi:DNA polymerase III subunit delta [Reinekea marinisedimentorum]|uniref:DNA polymerase III subunit delta n=1 Tax=Reinekea marinisedimentorum TaxID=230495 RepID=A0A4R3ICF0_9GAMM|nr:DNA polymerase III subunit delta [Reinekea marinisedimentorum]TCS43067.1 DNA polymerase III delta subunit [Reinekea marinisedimentorum]
MKLNAQQFHQNLQSSSLPPTIWISGDEPLQLLEASDAVRSVAQKAGITDRTVIEVDAKFDGAELIAANQSMSLFGDRQLIELRMAAKLNDKGRKALIEYSETANPDNLLLIVSPKLEASQTKAKWFSQVESSGWWLPIWPIERHQFSGWLNARLKQAGLSADPDALALLVERLDGNLLAAKQEIEKLALLSNGDLTAETVLASVSDSSRYTVFDLSAAFLAGDLARALKITHVLQGEGIEAAVVLWLITRELRLLIELAEAQQAGQPMAAAFKRLRIFDKRQRDYSSALQRCSAKHYQRCLIACAGIDAAVKGQVKDDVWSLISEMLVAICMPKLPAYNFQS